MEKYDREQGGLSNHPQISYVTNSKRKEKPETSMSDSNIGQQNSYHDNKKGRTISALIPETVSTVYTRKNQYIPDKRKSVSQSVPATNTEQQLTKFCEGNLYQHLHKDNNSLAKEELCS
jgi:hypothetical protein